MKSCNYARFYIQRFSNTLNINIKYDKKRHISYIQL